MNTKFNTKNVLTKGFSLVEMLVVIAVIGIIAAIAIPSIGSISSAAAQATMKRNAQNLVSVYQSGLADNVAWADTDEDTAVAAVITGGQGTDAFFTVRGLSAQAITDAKTKTSWTAGVGLSYTP